MKKIIFLCLCLLIANFVMAQGAQPIPKWEKDLAKYIVLFISWAVNNWDDVLGLFVGLLTALEILLRVFVSEKSLAPLTALILKLDKWLPNRTKNGTFKLTNEKQIDK